jgi:predicted enzyme related to lactoylglutathione lyase
MSKFVWFEYTSTQEQKAQGFFGEVFNWKTQTIPMPQGNYTMIAVGDRTIGGYGTTPKGAPEQAHWLSYLHATDVARSTAKVAKLGGKVLQEPFKVGEVGTMSIVADPHGGVFALWQPTSNEATPDPVDNTFSWNELTSVDPDASAKFYAEVGGFEIEKMAMGMDYTLLQSGGVPRAGITKPQMPGQPHAWLPYVQVANTDATTEKAKKLGATVVVPPNDIPNVGRFAVFLDPQGAALGIIQPPAR